MVDERKIRPQQTYLDLAAYLEEFEPDTDGQWPLEYTWAYDSGKAADVMAWRIRKGKIRLPDHEGGDRGKWAARVERVKKGRANTAGPARVYVKYLGVEA